MIKNKFNAQGYKAPVCKVVNFHMKQAFMQLPGSNGVDSASNGYYTNELEDLE